MFHRPWNIVKLDRIVKNRPRIATNTKPGKNSVKTRRMAQRCVVKTRNKQNEKPSSETRKNVVKLNPSPPSGQMPHPHPSVMDLHWDLADCNLSMAVIFLLLFIFLHPSVLFWGFPFFLFLFFFIFPLFFCVVVRCGHPFYDAR